MTVAGTPDDPTHAPPYRQDVHADGGNATGVIGGDLHVWGDGIPLFVLRNWQPSPTVPPGWLREVPSRMLNARYEVVPFTGREDDLAALEAWRDSEAPTAARWLHGPGGQGKTRLAARLAALSVAGGWKVLVAVQGPGTVLPGADSQDLRTDGAVGLLVIVDYADQWPLSHLTWLFSNSLLQKPGLPVRVLLIGRTDDAWPLTRAALVERFVDTSTQLLRPLGRAPRPDPAEGPRAAMFQAARDGYAARYGIDGSSVGRPEGLDHPDFGLTLTIHMAALVAVDAHVAGRPVPATGTAGLTVYLLDREQLWWARRLGDPGHDLAPAERTYRTPPATMNRLVFGAALTGAVPRAEGLAVVRRLGVTDDGDAALSDHRSCYPPSPPGADTVLEPLYPDRLAEDFLALTLPGHRADYPAQSWARPATTTLFGADEPPPAWSLRAVGMLAAAAQRWPHVGPECLFRLVDDRPAVILAAGNAAIGAVAGLDGLGFRRLTALVEHLEAADDTDLLPAMAAVQTRLTPYRLAENPDPEARITVLNDLAAVQTYAGRYSQAAATRERATGILRRLSAEVDPSDDRSPAGQLRHRASNRLGSALVDLSADLSAAGRRTEAVRLAEQAIALYREFGAARPSPDFSHAQLVRGHVARRAGRPAEALPAFQAAMRIRRRRMDLSPLELGDVWFLALHDPVARTLLRALNTVPPFRRRLQRLEETYLSPIDRIPNRWRYPASVEERAADLVQSLSHLGTALADTGRYLEARRASALAVVLARRHRRIRPLLGGALTELARALLATGQVDAARTAAAQAVAIHRELAVAPDDMGNPSLSVALLQLSRCRARTGDAAGAVAAAEEAVQVLRPAVANDAALESELPQVLGNLAERLRDAGDRGGAVQAATDAVAVARRMVRAEPAIHTIVLAGALHTLATCLTAAGRRAEALSAATESVQRWAEVPGASGRTPERAAAARTRRRLLLADHGRAGALRATADVARASVAAAWWRTSALVHTVLRPRLVNDRWRS
ncbi:hypothetical protein DLJ47_13695 [Micromonospora sp. S4605]|uniref:tetratricopeptide repeat protein n=1 Tax=Micromonospora sp. S4605 TaxID=1420897 RepID=UPI000D6F0833|nr:tetratricopeptide repeat protein [Micromonospora sp. S4605]PWU54234.1 hypothetical protein DLJ47_13695 [Micromonospora sp. S4605]